MNKQVTQTEDEAMTAMTTKQVREIIRAPYAWPGGYRINLITSDGGALCNECARKEYRSISSSIRNEDNDGWRVVAGDINWEDESLYCDHCNRHLRSEYGADGDDEAN